jgi:hypothetical protein
MEFALLNSRVRFFTLTNDNCGMIGDRKVVLVFGGKADAGSNARLARVWRLGLWRSP